MKIREKASSNVVGIICLLVGIGVTDLPKTGGRGAAAPLPLLDVYGPDWLKGKTHGIQEREAAVCKTELSLIFSAGYTYRKYSHMKFKAAM